MSLKTYGALSTLPDYPLYRHGGLVFPARWHPSIDTEAEAIQSSPRFFPVSATATGSPIT